MATMMGLTCASPLLSVRSKSLAIHEVLRTSSGPLLLSMITLTLLRSVAEV
jgi:hypothetical protein